jgi:hypothetical protein
MPAYIKVMPRKSRKGKTTQAGMTFLDQSDQENRENPAGTGCTAEGVTDGDGCGFGAGGDGWRRTGDFFIGSWISRN